MYNLDNLTALGENETHVKDASIFGNNGTYTTQVYYDWWKPGMAGNSLKFITFQYVNLTRPINFSATDNWTVLFWANKDPSGIDINEMIIGDKNDSNDFIALYDGSSKYLRFRNSAGNS